MASETRAGTARFGPFVLDLRSGELQDSRGRQRLGGKAFEALVLLLERAGEVVTREELRERLWPSDVFVDFENNLNAAVNQLRRALGDSAEAPRYVETVPRPARHVHLPGSFDGPRSVGPDPVEDHGRRLNRALIRSRGLFGAGHLVPSACQPETNCPCHVSIF